MPTITKRFWVFTLNVDNKEEWDPATIPIGQVVKAMVCQLEKAPTTGQLHWQGAIKFNNAVSMAAVKKVIGDKAHVEAMAGTWEQATEYCKKDKTRVEGETPYEAGNTKGGQGERTDLEEVRQTIKSGASTVEIADAHWATFLRYNKGIALYKHAIAKKRDFKTKVVVHYGAPGCGKSYNANKAAEGRTSFTLCQGNGDNIWWDGYDGQDVAILDDFYGWVRFSSMLQLMDRYEYQVEIKGARGQFTSKELHITSNAPPSAWYKYDEKKSWPAFLRRIDEAWYYACVDGKPVRIQTIKSGIYIQKEEPFPHVHRTMDDAGHALPYNKEEAALAAAAGLPFPGVVVVEDDDDDEILRLMGEDDY
ncbi:rep protein [Circoviridae sp.]|nr:rep protein [Circoviridae sp.]UOF79805.1 rep protein [Circoviridae sp.]